MSRIDLPKLVIPWDNHAESYISVPGRQFAVYAVDVGRVPFWVVQLDADGTVLAPHNTPYKYGRRGEAYAALHRLVLSHLGAPNSFNNTTGYEGMNEQL